MAEDVSPKRHPNQSCRHLNLSRGKTVVAGPRFIKLFVAASLMFAGAAFAQSLDSHIISDPAAPLYQRSSFAHGYRHGYEEGFHAADIDYHMGRDPQLLSCSEKRVSGTVSPKVKGYDRHFGDKINFYSGYEHGYIAGYTDSFNGRKFRALDLHMAALKDAPIFGDGRDFDAGFGDGYRTFSFHAQVASTEDKCPKNSATYCDGFQRGVAFGKADANIASDSMGHVLASSAQPVASKTGQ